MRDSPSLPAARTPFGAAASAVLLALAVLIIGAGTISKTGRNYDFRAFYCAGEQVRSAPAKLYEPQAQSEQQNTILKPHYPMPFYHPAYEALLFAPLTLLSYRSAYLVYLCWNLLLLMTCYLVAPRGNPVGRMGPPLFFLFLPVPICLVFGQDSILFLLLLCMVWRLLTDEHDGWAGVILALALFKLSVVPLLALLIAARRGWRFASSFLGPRRCWVDYAYGSPASAERGITCGCFSALP